MGFISEGAQTCACPRHLHAPKLVAITGGPGAGKTAVLEMASRTFCSHVGVLPEAAGIVFGGGFPRHGSKPGRRAAQRAIFHVQRQLETWVVEEARLAIALCDRGTVDGAAYWPDEPERLWDEVGTTLEAELARYAAVIHLHTPPAHLGYVRSNRLRVETADEAMAIDRRIDAMWRGHPRRLHIDSENNFLTKARRALDAIREQVPPCCREAVRPAC